MSQARSKADWKLKQVLLAVEVVRMKRRSGASSESSFIDDLAWELAAMATRDVLKRYQSTPQMDYRSRRGRSEKGGSGPEPYVWVQLARRLGGEDEMCSAQPLTTSRKNKATD